MMLKNLFKKITALAVNFITSELDGLVTGIYVISTFLRRKAGRALTAGEVDFARTVFGDTVDYARVRICHKHSTNKRADAYAIGRKIFVEKDLRLGDMSEADVFKKSIFMHELTHIWQRQNDKKFNTKNLRIIFGGKGGRDIYAYDMRGQEPFLSLGMEQQASIVEDFILSRELLAKVPEMPDKPETRLMIEKAGFSGPCKEMRDLTAARLAPVFPVKI